MRQKRESADGVFEKNDKGLILYEIWSEWMGLKRGRGASATGLGSSLQ